MCIRDSHSTTQARSGSLDRWCTISTSCHHSNGSGNGMYAGDHSHGHINLVSSTRNSCPTTVFQIVQYLLVHYFFCLKFKGMECFFFTVQYLQQYSTFNTVVPCRALSHTLSPLAFPSRLFLHNCRDVWAKKRPNTFSTKDKRYAKLVFENNRYKRNRSKKITRTNTCHYNIPIIHIPVLYNLF